MPMNECIDVAMNDSVRMVLALWACDPAALAQENVPVAADAPPASLYRYLGALPDRARARRHELAALCKVAQSRRDSGPRQGRSIAREQSEEAAEILTWLDPIMATDPVLRQLAQRQRLRGSLSCRP